MKTSLHLAAIGILLSACSIDVMSMTPTIEDVPVEKQASLQGISCILEGKVPHIANLESEQIAVNINSVIDEFVRELFMNNAGCPKGLIDLVVDDATLTDTTTVDYRVTMLENGIFSVVITESQYFEGAAHPNNSITTYTFSLIDGQPITLTDIFADVSDLPTFLTENIQRELAANNVDAEYPSDISNDTVKFYLTPDAVVLTDIFSVHALQGFEAIIPLTLPSI